MQPSQRRPVNALQRVQRRSLRSAICKPLRPARSRLDTGLGRADGTHRGQTATPVSGGATVGFAIIVCTA